MAVVKSHILSAGISGDVQGRDRHDTKASYRVRWFVQCDSPEDTAKTVLSHFRRSRDLPFLGDTYEAGNDRDSGAVCTSITPNLVERSGGIFYVDVEYSPAGGDNDEEKPSKNAPGKQTNDPREWNDEIDVSSTQISVPTEVAVFHGFVSADGKPVKNTFLKDGVTHIPCDSSLQPFDPPLEHEVDIVIYRFTKYTEEFHFWDLQTWLGTVNSDRVTIDKRTTHSFATEWEPFTARIRAIPSTYGVANGIPYWRTSIEVHVNPLGWRRQVVDRGFCVRQEAGDRRWGDGSIISPSELEDNGANVAVIRDPDGYPITTPVLLDGNGQPLPKGKPVVYSVWSQYPERPFGGINW